MDEFDKGIRMILNFGHTIGHAIEKSFKEDFISHGEAISFGMIHILEIFEEEGVTGNICIGVFLVNSSGSNKNYASGEFAYL